MSRKDIGFGYPDNVEVKVVNVYDGNGIHVRAIEYHLKNKGRQRKIEKQDITKEEFLANLGKVAQSISRESDTKSDSEKI